MTKKIIEHFPFIEDIEESLFKAFLQDRKLWVDFKDHISVDYYNIEAHAKIFKIFQVYFNKYHDFPTEKQCLNIVYKKKYNQLVADKIIKIFNFVDLKEKELRYLYDECNFFIKSNKIKNSIMDSVDLVEKSENEIDEDKRKEYTLAIESNIKEATSWNLEVKLGTKITDVNERFEQYDELNRSVMKTPWSSINQVIGGGVFSKELTLVASSSSVGKSIWLDNFARYAWAELKKNVLVITLEMSETRKFQRIDAEMFNIPMGDVIFNKDKIIKYFKSNKYENELYIKEFPTASVNINHLKQYVYQLELYTGFKPDIIYIDYLDIMLPTRRANDDYVDQGAIGAELRGWAVETDVPVVSATQLNRLSKSVTIEDLSEEHLADSYKKLMIADTIIFLSNTPEQRQNGIIGCKIGKARNGVKDIIFSLGVDYPKLKIFERKKK